MTISKRCKWETCNGRATPWAGLATTGSHLSTLPLAWCSRCRSR